LPVKKVCIFCFIIFWFKYFNFLNIY
jgi:hypothetical protein